LARKIKTFYHNKCQLCGDSIKINDNALYSEAHHIRPLGSPHNGPDDADNIIVLCPNHHVMLDYGAVQIDLTKITIKNGHHINEKYVEYHNNKLYGRL
jgi:predicted restriction endonuclease